MRKLVITPILILLSILLIISGATAINGLLINSGGGSSLGGGIALIITLFILGILIAEQAIVANLRRNMRVVWIIELLLIAMIIVILRMNGFELSIG